jgi:prevent-host-death family protein
MAVQINIAEAKAKLSSLLARALAGEEIVIARAGKPLVRLMPIEKRTRRKKRSVARLENLERSVAGTDGARRFGCGRGEAHR